MRHARDDRAPEYQLALLLGYDWPLVLAGLLGFAVLARRLLANTDMQLGDVARALGFKTQAGFNKAFMRWQGVAPGTLRAGQRRRPRLTLQRD